MSARQKVGSQKKTGLAVRAAVMAVLGAASAALAVSNPPAVTKANNKFFDWQINITPSYVPSPFVTNDSANAVRAFLQSEPSGTIRAVKIERPITNTTASIVFDSSSYHVSYVFGDLESSNATSQLKTLVNQVKYANNNPDSTKTYSYNAFIGNFGYTRAGNDGYQPSGVNLKGNGDFSSAGLNMAMPVLYPGTGSYKNPAAGNSSAPNIRSALFNYPILRTTAAKVNAKSGEAVVPWVARFNNWANLSLDTDRNASNGYAFVPGLPMPAKNGLPAIQASDTINQMLSRRDFATQMAHYRLRGADTYVAFDSGVVGYNNEQKRNDMKQGWTEPHINAIFAKSDYKLLLGNETGGSKDLNDDMTVDGKTQTDEKSGSIFSGIYSLSLGKLDVLLSNMDDSDHDLTLPSKIGGFSLNKKTFSLDGGESLLVEYKLLHSGPGKTWSLAFQQTPFLNLPNNRNEIGIPEPTTMTLAAMVSMIAISRRRNRRGSSPEAAKAVSKTKGPAGLCGANLPGDCFVG